jgi:hypothetical protein
MPKSQSQPTLTESNRIPQPGQQLIENFFNSLTQLNDVDAEVAQMLQTLYTARQLSRDAILRKLAEMRGKQND